MDNHASGAMSKVREEVLKAYRPFVKAVAAQLQNAMLQDDMHGVYAEATSLFAQLDANGDEEITFQELRQGLQSWGKDLDIAQGDDDALLMQFQLFDTDNSGGITLDEALYLFYNLMSTMPRRSCRELCPACPKTLNPFTDIGFQCSCTSDPNASRAVAQDRPCNLCHNCHELLQSMAVSDGEGVTVQCPQHHVGEMLHLQELIANMPQEAEHPAPVVLAVPGVNEEGSPASGVECMCCGDVHTIVLSYVRPQLGDLHMRPVVETDEITGEQDIKGFVCEYCAMRVCSRHNNSLWWDTDHATPNSCLQDLNCPDHSTCAGAGEDVQPELVKQQVQARTAAYCPTCNGKLGQRGKLWEDEPLSPDWASFIANQHCEAGPSHRDFNSSSSSSTNSSSSGARAADSQTVEKVCYCCGEKHHVQYQGKPVSSYMEYLGSSGQHMTELPDGRWACEFCTAWMCERCGEGRRRPPDCAVLGSWSQPGLTCGGQALCQGPGNCQFDRDLLSALAHGDLVQHCEHCRDKLLGGRMYGMQRPGPAAAANQSARPGPGDMPSTGSRGRAPEGGRPGDHERIETCCCCQQRHHVQNLGKPVDSYLAQLRCPGQHMTHLSDGRWVCEFCTAWICTRCACTGRMTADDAKVGNWSRKNKCSNKCKKTGSWQFDRAALFRLADGGQFTHCRFCRRELLSNKIYDHQLIQKRANNNRNRERLQLAADHVKAFDVGMQVATIGGTIATSLATMAAAGACSIM